MAKVSRDDIFESSGGGGIFSQDAKSALELKAAIDQAQASIDKMAKSAKSLSSGINPGASVADMQKLSEAFEKSTKARKDSIQVQTEQEKLQAKLTKLESEEAKVLAQLNVKIQEQRKANKDLAKETLGLTNAYDKLVKDTDAAQKNFKKLAAEFGVNSKQARSAKAEFEKLDNELREINQHAKDGRRDVGRYGDAIKGAGASMRNFASALGVVTGIQLVTRTLKDAFNITREFDQAQANLASILGVSREAMGPLTQQAKDLGATTKFTAAQVSELQTEFAKLGFTQSDIQNVTESTLSLAAAAGTDLATAASVAGATIRGFGLSTTETQRVVDVMAKSFSASSLDMSKFQVAMAAVAPVANSAGVSIERTTALIGTLTDRGIDASSAGTGLRNIFLDLTRHGITWDEAMSKINNSSDKAATSLDLFGKRGATLGVILAENQGSISQLEGTLKGAGGAAKEMADKQIDTLSGSLDILRSAWEGYILGADGATGASEGLKNVIKALADNLPLVLDTALSLIGAFVGFKVLKASAALFKGLSIATKGATFSMKGLNAAMKANPLGLLIVGIELLVAAFFFFREEIDAVIGSMVELFSSWENFKKGVVDMVVSIAKFFGLVDEGADSVKKLTAEQERANKVNAQALKQGKEVLKQSQAEISSMQIMLTALTDVNTTNEERQRIIKELNERYPELIGNIDLETASTEDLVKVKKALTKQILQQAIEEKKLAAIKQFTNKIIELEVELLLAPTEAARNQIQKQIDELAASVPLIEEIADRVGENIDGVVDGMTDNGEKYTEVTDDIRTVTAALNSALASGDTERAALLQKQLDDLEAKRKRLLGFGVEGPPVAEDEEGTGEGKHKKDKKAEDKRNKEIEDLRRKHQLEMMQIENEGISAGLDADMIKQQQFERRRTQLQEELELIKKLYGEGSKEVIEATIELNNEWLKLQKEFAVDRIDIQTETINNLVQKEETLAEMQARLANEALQKEIARLKALREARKDAYNKMLQDSLKFFQDQLNQAAKSIDDQIALQRMEIDASEDRIKSLEEKADAGNLEAEESLKAEELRVAEANAEIAELEKKKTNLLILTTFLQAAQLGLEQGNSNAFSKANNDLSEGLAKLPKLMSGTKKTLGDELGKTGTPDGHLIWADDKEMILNPGQVAQLQAAGLTRTDQIVDNAMAYQGVGLSRDILSRHGEQRLDNWGVLAKEMREVKSAIEHIPDYGLYVDELMKIATIVRKEGNHTDIHHKRIGGHNKRSGGAFS